MHKLTFTQGKDKTLAAILDFAADRPRRRPYEDKTTKAQGFWLVKDEGIYLMSPTADNFVQNGTDDKNTVVYARGYKPTKSNEETLWDKTHAVSGDDFAEFIVLTNDQVERVLGGGNITIDFGATNYGVRA